ncbi:Hypothetical protein R9X50_00148200 [Acrodontium crateriforme]|uniref:DUF7896 domain-containing protein n=1 Tax=Acrodontium crateriforme TaxID=150365 RepID=A0AAQ3LZK0_9PEZI|nr:Hypothetical protein R9X50_00148200 [Acrodontium crateriforme]
MPHTSSTQVDTPACAPLHRLLPPPAKHLYYTIAASPLALNTRLISSSHYPLAPIARPCPFHCLESPSFVRPRFICPAAIGTMSSLIRSLEQERDAIWRAHPTEQARQQAWAQRAAEVRSYLALDPSLAATASPICQRSLTNQGQSQRLRRPSIAVDRPSKKPRHCINMQHSASYAYGSVPSWPGSIANETTVLAAQPQQQQQQHNTNDVQVYDIAAYVAKLNAEPVSYNSMAPKRQCIDHDMFEADRLSSMTCYGNSFPSATVPITHAVSRSSSSSSTSSDIFSDAAISRQSSSTTIGMSDSFDMLRVDSSAYPYCSVNDDIFPCSETHFLPDLPLSSDPQAQHSSFQEYPTPSPSVYNNSIRDETLFSSSSNQGIGADSQKTTMMNGTGGEKFISTRQPAMLCQSEFFNGPLQYDQRMQLEHSQKSNGNGPASFVRTDARQAKPRSWVTHQPALAPKTTTVQLFKRQQQSDPQSHRTIAPQNPQISRARVEALVRVPYTRPQHPKLYCPHCNENPTGFRGEHELRRHVERAHASRKRVWICRMPSNPSKPPMDSDNVSAKSEPGPWRPAKPLEICRQCKNRKTYNVYYNAAAHLRRAHFCPRKRGRRAKGEVRESRAGKAGGDWPSIEWLKNEGWLVEIEVDGDNEVEKSAYDVKDDKTLDDVTEPVDLDQDSECDDYDSTDSRLYDAQIAAENLGLHSWNWGSVQQPVDGASTWPETMSPLSQQQHEQDEIALCGGVFEAPEMVHSATSNLVFDRVLYDDSMTAMRPTMSMFSGQQFYDGHCEMA